MAIVSAPLRGKPYRITKGGYVDGRFYLGGRRIVRALCRIEALAKTAEGKRRTPGQLNQAIMRLWEVKRAEIESQVEAEAPATGRNVGELMDDWIKHGQSRGLDPETVRIMSLCRKLYLEIVGDHAINLATTQRGDRFMRGLGERGLGPVRVNNYLGRFAAFLKWAALREHLSAVPLIDRMKESPPKVRPTDVKVARALLDALTEQSKTHPNPRQRHYKELLRLALLVWIGTGMRRGEAYAIRREHIDLDARAIRLVTTKTGRERVVRVATWLRDELKQYMAKYPGDSWLFENPGAMKDPKLKGAHAWHAPSAMTTALARVRKEEKLPAGSKIIQGFRQLFASAGLNTVGVEALPMQAQLGHRHLDTTRTHYVEGMGDAQLRMVDALDRRFMGKVVGLRASGRKVGERKARATTRRKKTAR